ncbi:PREDICTED: uncharacterized protein LOC104727289 [Camelina sativa]|uniref:Uncharacterized protein LOC104727289 n=1 Tax=Camelina sativa TaxID=90675 RepID=A0ABM0UQQ5_CAMSA|nr:PREDICTED: uncharacterized protein LOC104727289 [Camelina sativa]
MDLGIDLHATVAEALLHRKRNHRVDHLNQIEMVIEGVRQKGLLQAADKVLWKGNGDRYKQTFHSKETWECIRFQGQRRTWYKGIWFSQATPKYSFIVWLATLNRLTTGDRMQQWSTSVDTSCPLCSAPLETRNHLFFTCPYSAEIWTNLASKLLTTKFTTVWETILALLTDSSLEKSTLFLLRYTFQASVHSLWKERNSRRHGEPHVSPALFIKRTDRLIRNRLLSIHANEHYAQCLSLWLATR